VSNGGVPDHTGDQEIWGFIPFGQDMQFQTAANRQFCAANFGMQTRRAIPLSTELLCFFVIIITYWRMQGERRIGGAI